MSTCTQNIASEAGGARYIPCPALAMMQVGWSELIREGFIVTTSRKYCQAHGDAKIEELAKRGVTASKGSA